jgi:hypothetical protein
MSCDRRCFNPDSEWHGHDECHTCPGADNGRKPMQVKITSLTRYGMDTNAQYQYLVPSIPKVGEVYNAEHIPAIANEPDCVRVNGYIIHPDDFEVVK